MQDIFISLKNHHLNIFAIVNTKTEIEESWEKSVAINLPGEDVIKTVSPSKPLQSILNENIETTSRGPNLNIQDDEIDLYSEPNIN